METITIDAQNLFTLDGRTYKMVLGFFPEAAYPLTAQIERGVEIMRTVVVCGRVRKDATPKHLGTFFRVHSARKADGGAIVAPYGVNALFPDAQ